jgi:hypothetical protein
LLLRVFRISVHVPNTKTPELRFRALLTGNGAIEVRLERSTE